MTQVQFFRVWWRLRPKDFPRAKWFRLGASIHATGGALSLPFRDPRFWWFCRRVQLAIALGLPPPKSDRQRGILRA
jgi:hypothetical protein